jgi:hypothetical protein
MTMLVSFTFNANRESDYQASISLFREHFPGAYRQGFNLNIMASRGVRITCTADQFVKWIHERDQMGFVNRMHQLQMAISYSPGHFRNGLEEHKRAVEVYEQKLQPIEYSTPEATGVA